LTFLCGRREKGAHNLLATEEITRKKKLYFRRGGDRTAEKGNGTTRTRN